MWFAFSGNGGSAGGSGGRSADEVGGNVFDVEEDRILCSKNDKAGETWSSNFWKIDDLLADLPHA